MLSVCMRKSIFGNTACMDHHPDLHGTISVPIPAISVGMTHPANV